SAIPTASRSSSSARRPDLGAHLTPSAALPVDGAFELPLRHLRAARDASLAGLVVELVVRSPARAAVRPQAAASAGGDVPGGRPAALPGFAVTRAFLVHRPGRDLLGRVLAAAPFLQSFLDVFVLPFALVARRLPRHARPPPVVILPSRYRIAGGGN